MAVDNHPINSSIIILAAGESSRLGSPKQLLPYAGKNLLQHSIDVARASAVETITVMLGANADLIQSSISDTAIKIIVHNEWKEGMASTIRFGLNTLTTIYPQTEAVIFMVADQPFTTAELLDQLLDAHRTNGSKIVAAKYLDTFGTPVLFHKTFFPELLQLKGDVGAKSLVRKYLHETAFVPFPKGHIDIDTIDDYNNLSLQ